MHIFRLIFSCKSFKLLPSHMLKFEKSHIVLTAIKVAVIWAASTKHLHPIVRPQTAKPTEKWPAGPTWICSNDDIPPPLVPAVVVLTFLTLCKEETQRRSLSIYNRPWTFYWHNTHTKVDQRACRELKRCGGGLFFPKRKSWAAAKIFALRRAAHTRINYLSAFPCSLRVWAN